MALRTVGVRLVAEVSDYTRKIKGAGQTTKDFAGEMSKAAKAGKLDAVADQAAVAGVALVGLAGTAVKMAMDFDKSMSAVSAATHASAKDLGQLREAAIQAGKDTQYSATEAADAITELSKAGVATSQILGGGLDGALDLAAAGQLDVAEAAETAASAMTQFKLSGDKVPHIADLLAAAAGKAQGSVHDMGYALNQSGLVASQFGLSIEDTTGALAEFANAGLIGSDAGTSFKSMLLAMANPSGVTSKKMQELGISFYDAQGRFIGLSGVADELRDKLGRLTEEERNAALGQIFGSDAIRAATVLYKDGSKGVEEWRNKVNDAGYASETAAKLTDNLAGDLERLRGSLETMAIEAGGGANSGLRVMAKSANALVDEVGQLPPVVSGGMTVLAALGGTTLLAAAGWVKMRRSTAEALSELRSTGPAGEKAARGLQSTTKWAGRAAAAFAAFEAAQAAVSAFQTDLNPQVEALSNGLADYSVTGKLAGETSRLLGDDMSKLSTHFKFIADDSARSKWVRGLQGGLESIIPGLDGTETSLARTRERVTALDQALSQLVQGGRASQAKAAFDKLAATLATNGVSMDEFKKQFPQYAAALEVAGSKTTDTASDIDTLGEAAGGASGEMMALSKSVDELFQVQMSSDRAALKLADSTSALTEELMKGKRTLSLNSEEGRKNRAAILDQLDAIEANRDARVRGGETMEKASALYQKDIDGLKKIMKQAGFTKKQIDDLTGAYEDIPGHVDTKIGTPGLPAAREGIKGYDKQLDKLARNVKTQVSVDGKAKAYKELTDLLVLQQAAKKGISVSAARSAFNKNAYATGGPVVGPGTGTSDSIAAWLSNGEHVWTAAEVAAIGGQQAMMALRGAVRSGKRVEVGDETPGFAKGGPVVAMPFPVSVKDMKIPEWSAPPAGGHTSDWIVSAVRAVFPHLQVLSKDRPGAVTLTGNTSYHARGRAVDFEPSRALAEWVNANYFAATRELITPWNDLNIHNGQRHRYTGAVWNQHNFAGGNAHDHWAMARGGTITEPIFGVGASGRTYSFGENYQPERVMPNWSPAGAGGGGTTIINLTAQLAAGANVREAGRQIAEQLQTYLVGGGTVYVRGEKVLG